MLHLPYLFPTVAVRRVLKQSGTAFTNQSRGRLSHSLLSAIERGRKTHKNSSSVTSHAATIAALCPPWLKAEEMILDILAYEQQQEDRLAEYVRSRIDFDMWNATMNGGASNA